MSAKRQYSMRHANLIRSRYMTGKRSVQHATMSNAMLLAGLLRPNGSSLRPLLSGLGRGCPWLSFLSSSEELDSESARSSSSTPVLFSKSSPSGERASDNSGDAFSPCVSISSEACSPTCPRVACWWSRGSGGGGEGNKLRCSVHKSLQIICTIIEPFSPVSG